MAILYEYAVLCTIKAVLMCAFCHLVSVKKLCACLFFFLLVIFISNCQLLMLVGVCCC